MRLFDAFVNFKGGAEPIIAFADLSRSTEVVKTAFLVITVLTSDAMIVSTPFDPLVRRVRLSLARSTACTSCGAITGSSLSSL